MITKIALVQQTAGDDIHANLRRGLHAVQTASDAGAKIVCFAELAFQPFFPQFPAAVGASSIHVEPIPGPIVDALSEVAAWCNVAIVANLYEQHESHRYDSSPVIGPDGSLLGVTRMIHITGYDCFHEKDYYHPGDSGAPVYDTPFGRIGVAICYDRHFPEYMRALAIGGAQIVFVPQAGAVDEWPEGLFQAEMQVTSFQNGYFTALCNRVGKEPRLTFSGESFVCDPSGRVVAQAGKLTEEILYADLDLGKVDASHARQQFLPDRRADLYRHWVD